MDLRPAFHINSAEYKYSKGINLRRIIHKATISLILFCALLPVSIDAEIVTTISDHFDDGNITTNKLGTGSGFNINVDDRGGTGGTIQSEDDGNLTLQSISSADGDYSSTDMVTASSRDSFNFYNSSSITITYDITKVDAPVPGKQWDFGRSYIGLFNAGATNAGLESSGNSTDGLWIQLFGSGTGANVGMGTQGGLLLRKDSVNEIVHTWNWNSFDGTGPLQVVLELNDIGYSTAHNHYRQ